MAYQFQRQFFGRYQYFQLLLFSSLSTVESPQSFAWTGIWPLFDQLHDLKTEISALLA